MSRPQLSETSHHEKVYPVSPEWARRSWVDESKYKAWYEKAVAEPAAFWSEHAGRIDWFKPFTKVKNTSFGPGEVCIRWFEDGVTNVAYNCIDRHLVGGRRPFRVEEDDLSSNSTTVILL